MLVRHRLAWLFAATALGLSQSVWGQVRARLPEMTPVAQSPAAPAPAASTPPATLPPATAPSVPSTPAVPPATPGFDPYATTPGTLTPTAPAVTAPPTGGTWTAPTPATGTLGTPQTPPALFPNGLGTWNPQVTSTYGTAPMRLFYGPRARYTWLAPKIGDREFGSNDFDVGITATLPNFLWSGRPLFASPGFGLHLWDGPKPPVTSHLPSRAYDAYLDLGWSTSPERILSGEVGVRLGVFSDFNTFTRYSGRIQGLGQFHVQMTPTVRLTGGVLYLNRNRYKLFPTAGILWQPNSRSRYDIYFPRPKLAHYVTTIGNYDVWFYVGAEYGGGAWTIKQPDGTSERIDINDIRLLGGFEWGQASLMADGKRTGFIEAGWVTRRDIIYVVRPEA